MNPAQFIKAKTTRGILFLIARPAADDSPL
jgi:hypothetical protein